MEKRRNTKFKNISAIVLTALFSGSAIAAGKAVTGSDMNHYIEVEVYGK